MLKYNTYYLIHSPLMPLMSLFLWCIILSNKLVFSSEKNRPRVWIGQSVCLSRAWVAEVCAQKATPTMECGTSHNLLPILCSQSQLQFTLSRPCNIQQDKIIGPDVGSMTGEKQPAKITVEGQHEFAFSRLNYSWVKNEKPQNTEPT